MRGKNPKRSGHARRLRSSGTRMESELWKRLRNRQLGGCKFVRQEPIGPYFADFVCRERRLIVGVDGGQHAESATDRARDKAVEALGYRVIRIWNNDILENIDGVLLTLKSELEQAPHPSPLPASGARE